MSYIGVIVESPAKCGKIEQFLGPGYKAIASYGHFRELNGLESVDVENNYTPRFANMRSKSTQIAKLRSFIAHASEVMLAADDDREGEAIAWHVCDAFGLPVETTKRIIFHEITAPALKRAVDNPGRINMDLVRAQQARQVLDLLVGFRVSPVLWDKISHKTKSALSAGRCQTPALRLVYDNKKDIEASPGRKVYNTTGYFTSKHLPFSLSKNHEGEEAMGQFLEDSASFEHKYSCGKIRHTTKNPPIPFTTSGLQQTASNELRISPKATMEACQKLYEGGYITYMRTDSTTYSKEFLAEARQFITDKYTADDVSPTLDSLSERKTEVKKTKGKKKKEESEAGGAQEAHEAIRPTQIKREKTGDEMSAKEARVYLLIRRNTLESCMAPARYQGITGEITAPESAVYKYPTEQVVFPGWKKVGGYEETNPAFAFLQTLKKNSIVPYGKIVSKVTMKELKSHYTEAKLVQLLETNGIGRPSTFSSLVDKIQQRGYVKKENVNGQKVACVDFELEGDQLTESTTEREFGKENGKLVIQPLGVLVSEFLNSNFNSLFSYQYTKSMEDSLDQIAKGLLVWHELCSRCSGTLDDLIKPLGVVKKVTIEIDANHTYMIGKFGPVIKKQEGRKTSFLPVREDISVERLREGGYSLEEIIAAPKKKGGSVLGAHLGHEVVLLTGKFGSYLECDGRKYNVPSHHTGEVTLEDAIRYMTNIRHVGANAQVRDGSYGPYVMVKNGKAKPKFLHLRGFEPNPYLCDQNVLKEWIQQTHSVEL